MRNYRIALVHHRPFPREGGAHLPRLTVRRECGQVFPAPAEAVIRRVRVGFNFAKWLIPCRRYSPRESPAKVAPTKIIPSHAAN